jgi:hypothetical protein
MKPLFIPLKRKYYEDFETGKKQLEFRPYGPRWNERTCVVGRPVIVSCGYGKQRRLCGIVTYFERLTKENHPRKWASISELFEAIYGKYPDDGIAAIGVDVAQQ